MDVEREERRRYGAWDRKSRVVQAEPWDPDEIYYPRVDSACTRDLGLIVTDGASYFSEEKRDARSHVSLLAPGVQAFHLENTSPTDSTGLKKTF